MDQRHCVPYFVNTPPPNIRKDFNNGGKEGGKSSTISRNFINLDTNASHVNKYVSQINPVQPVGDCGIDKHGIGTMKKTDDSDEWRANRRYSTGNNSISGLRDNSNIIPQSQSNRYRIKNDLEAVIGSTDKSKTSSFKTVNNDYKQYNYSSNMQKIDTRESYETLRSSGTSTSIDFSRPFKLPDRPPPMSQYQSSIDNVGCPDVTVLSRNSDSPLSKLGASSNLVLQRSGSFRSPGSVQSQQSGSLRSSGSSSRSPQGSQRSSLNSYMTTSHLVGPAGTTEMQFIKSELPPTGVMAPPRQPPMPAEPPPSSTPPPPPPGPPPEVKRQVQPPPFDVMRPPYETNKKLQFSQIESQRQMLPPPGTSPKPERLSQTPPFDVRRQLQTLPYEASSQLSSSSQDVGKHFGSPPVLPSNLKQQMQTPPPQFVTPPGKLASYAQTPPFYLAAESLTDEGLFRVPPPPINASGAVKCIILQGSLTNPYYTQGNPYTSPQTSGYNYYKRNRVTDNLDPELRRGSKKKKKSLAQILPQRKGWSVEDAKKAIEIEKECSRNMRKYSLFIKFPDPELNRQIVSSFHSAIESVHFQQPSTPRFCFVNISSSADPEAVRQELNKVQFGGGYLSAEFKKDREDDCNINPEDIDPTTLYVGNLAQEVTKDDMVRTYPQAKRIDIGYARKMKFTRYAFVSFKTAADAMEAYKKTHDTQMYNKSLIVRFRRLNGTIGMLGEPKLQSKTETDRKESKNIETSDHVSSEENEVQNNEPWNIDVSAWESNYNELCYVEDEDDDDYDDDVLDVKPSVEDLVKDIKISKTYGTSFLSGPIDLGEIPRPKILDENKKEEGIEESDEKHTFSDSQNGRILSNEALPILPVNPNYRNGDVVSPDMNDAVVKSEPETKIKSELDENSDDRTARSTYRQLMLARRQKKPTIKVKEECSNTADTDGEPRKKDSYSDNTKIDQVHSQDEGTEDSIRPSAIRSPDNMATQLCSGNSSSNTDAGDQLSKDGSNNENSGEIKKEIKEEIPHSSTNSSISTYANLRQYGKKMKMSTIVEVKKENEEESGGLHENQMPDVNAQDIGRPISPEKHKRATEQAREEDNVQNAELTQNQDNMKNAIQPNNTECPSNESDFDLTMRMSPRENEASKQNNDDFNIDLDFDNLDNIKTEPRMEDDFDSDTDLDEEDDDDFSIFLERRKAQT